MHLKPGVFCSPSEVGKFVLIARPEEAGINRFVVSPDYMVSVVEGLNPAGVSGVMSGGGSGTSAEQ